MSLSLGRLFRRVSTRFHINYKFNNLLNRFVKRLPRILLILLLSLTVFYIFLHPSGQKAEEVLGVRSVFLPSGVGLKGLKS